MLSVTVDADACADQYDCRDNGRDPVPERLSAKVQKWQEAGTFLFLCGETLQKFRLVLRFRIGILQPLQRLAESAVHSSPPFSKAVRIFPKIRLIRRFIENHDTSYILPISRTDNPDT